ncbi:alpha/beta fold hydrolase [Shinella sedimenti]|uniref:Alpha/beta hydrolase n=1 Tax=Shinella sedimenti TaxID=2919913 RepID=A0ABT0CHX2_9HYPH|nr:alpha/beta hydrolase [Shinella sedimenti]MCJ8148219.1 alpha/beta hydrolase [Shinella sedimenti]
MSGVDQAGWNGRKRALPLRDGRSLAFIDAGAGDVPLFLLHGYTDSSRSWSLIEPHLARGYRLVMPDLPGHGLSAASPSPRLKAFADDVAELADALGIARFAVVGHSMGAMTALVLAACHPARVTALASICGSVTPGRLAQTTLGAEIAALSDPIDPQSAFLQAWHACARPVDAAFLRWVAREAAAMPAPRWQALYAMLEAADLSRISEAVRAPLLLLAGEEDALFGEPHRAALRHAFPNATVGVLAGHSHNPHWESPALVAAALAGFLAAQPL